jgi:hypothetical protein
VGCGGQKLGPDPRHCFAPSTDDHRDSSSLTDKYQEVKWIYDYRTYCPTDMERNNFDYLPLHNHDIHHLPTFPGLPGLPKHYPAKHDGYQVRVAEWLLPSHTGFFKTDRQLLSSH